MNRDEILNALNRCEPYVIPECCKGCPYDGCQDTKEECITQLHADAQTLISDSQPIRIVPEQTDKVVWRIPVDFKQTDQRWAREMYSNHGDPHQTILSSGSAPTLCADIVATLKDDSVTPPILARLALEWGCRTYSDGTSWPFFQKVAERYNFKKFVQSNQWNALIDCLDSRGYVICLMKRGCMCSVPNYVLAWSYDARHIHCYCADSKSKTRQRQPIDRFRTEARMFFCFYPA